MSLLIRNRSLFPSFESNIFDTSRLLAPNIFDYDVDLFDVEGGSLVVPEVNIIENAKDFTVELAAPGLERKDFKVELDNGMLTISAEKKQEKKEDGKNYRRREFSYNSFRRSFTLPENVLADKADAHYENGILKLTLPKKEVVISKPAKQIKVV